MNNSRITFTYKDIPYTLEYSRNAIKRMEASGFSMTDFVQKPMTNIELAFKGLFIKNHQKTPEKLIMEIYENMKNKEELSHSMIEMIEECYSSLFDDEEKDSGNIQWDMGK